MNIKFAHVPIEPRDLMLLARNTLEAAKRAALATEKAARKRAVVAILRARKRAIKRGFREGFRQAKSEMTRSLLNAEKAYADSIISARKECLEICTTLVRHILSDPSLTLPSLPKRIEHALGKINETTRLELQLNPLDAAVVADQIEELFCQVFIQISTDASIPRGNAVIVTPHGRVELSWEEHLSLLKALLAERLRNNPIYMESPDHVEAA